MSVESVKQNQAKTTNAIEMPAPTAWPIVLAFGIALLFGGLVTNAAVSILGGILAAAAGVGWFRDVLPFEAHEMVTVTAEVPAVTTSRPGVIPIAAARELRRAFLPLEIYPVSAGVKGGLAGSAAMAVTAMLYGALSRNGIWYPVNLLAAGFLPPAMTDTVAKLSAFNPNTLLIAATIHLITSLLVGLLYGAMLPMLPRRPALLGGLVAPLMWTGLIHSVLGIVNPVLNQRIDWFWFGASQVAFGVIAGVVVARQERIRTWQRLPLSLRSGMEATGMRDDNT
jgi:hypothetical protein